MHFKPSHRHTLSADRHIFVFSSISQWCGGYADILIRLGLQTKGCIFAVWKGSAPSQDTSHCTKTLCVEIWISVAEPKRTGPPFSTTNYTIYTWITKFTIHWQYNLTLTDIWMAWHFRRVDEIWQETQEEYWVSMQEGKGGRFRISQKCSQFNLKSTQASWDCCWTRDCTSLIAL